MNDVVVAAVVGAGGQSRLLCGSEKIIVSGINTNKSIMTTTTLVVGKS